MTTLQEYLNQKYPTSENKATVKEINLAQISEARKQAGITELLEGGELDLKEFKNLEEVIIVASFLKTPLTKIEVDGLTKLKELVLPLEPKEDTEEEKKLWEELGIAENIEQKKVVKEINKLGELKGVKVNFNVDENQEEKEGEISLSLDKKDQQGNFSPSLIFWNLAHELASMDIGGDKTDKTPEFWKQFEQEKIWVKENLTEEYQKEFELLLTPSTFPTERLEINELLNIYYPNSEDIPNSQVSSAVVKKEIVNETWQKIREKLIALTSQAVSENPSEEKLAELVFKTTIDYNASEQEYTIQVNYHSSYPFSKELEELISTTPLKLENELLKQEKEQLPTSENFEKLTKQNRLLDNYLQDLTDEENYQKIKEKINEIK